MKSTIESGKTYLGIEFGSTRIKAVLIDDKHKVIASSSHEWKNKLENGVWTYSLDAIWSGLRDCYAKLKETVFDKYSTELTEVGAIGVSGMMHGYLAFDKDCNLLVPFRTWRNTITGEAAAKLTQELGFNIPQRWSVAHLYQAIINKEPHVDKISYITTLAGYIHWKLTGKKVLGIGDASGMFPIDDQTRKYNENMLGIFSSLVEDENLPWDIKSILPDILNAGESAGKLTEEGAKLLDESGKLKAGISMCPPEGDAGTGMIATNAISKRTGNVSAGTSVFAMVVLEGALSKVYPEIDLVTTPAGDAVGMVHCNNCLGDIDAWVKLMGEAAALLGAEFDINTLYGKLYNHALEGDVSCKGMAAYNYLSGEHITGFEEGRPLFMREPTAEFNLANFMRTQLYTTCASLKLGMNILVDKESVKIDCMTGHGGFFKQANVGQKIMSAAMNAPISVMETAGEGGPWGMAILAAYMVKKGAKTLDDYLSEDVFADVKSVVVYPESNDAEGFNEYLKRFSAGLKAEHAAVESLR